ncbi:MAG: response regulator transcription factor [Oscillospiraceae bacterium]|nr:response regulator transcription factor [Oscillospiraceae bacterium]
MPKILVVEDDNAIVKNLCELLSSEGFVAEAAVNCSQAIEKLKNESYDLILLDVLLPDGNGFAVCAAAKELSAAPIIFLTASADEYSVVMGLDMGADDYIEKPYRPRELISRIRSVLRRSSAAMNVIVRGNVTVDLDKASVMKDGREVFLSALEYKLLLVFINNPKAVLTRSRLLNEIWDVAGDFVGDNTLTVYIKRLRNKIEDDPQNPKIILTVRGIGYRLGDE